MPKESRYPCFEDDDDRAYRAWVAEQGVLAAVDRGWVTIAGVDDRGRSVYQLTDAGKQRAREVLGLPPDVEIS